MKPMIFDVVVEIPAGNVRAGDVATQNPVERNALGNNGCDNCEPPLCRGESNATVGVSGQQCETNQCGEEWQQVARLDGLPDVEAASDEDKEWDQEERGGDQRNGPALAGQGASEPDHQQTHEYSNAEEPDNGWHWSIELAYGPGTEGAGEIAREFDDDAYEALWHSGGQVSLLERALFTEGDLGLVHAEQHNADQCNANANDCGYDYAMPPEPLA